jgi:hypothetical protein
MIKLKITPEIIQKAESKLLNLRKKNNSFMDGERELNGLIGQILACEYLQAEDHSTTRYDLIKNGKTIDVKTKTRSVEPRLNAHFRCHVPKHCCEEKKCDYFVFVGLEKSLNFGWLLGKLTWESFKEKAEFCPQGTLDPYSNEKFPLIFKASEYSVFIDELEPIKFINNDFYLIEKEKDWYFQ